MNIGMMVYSKTGHTMSAAEQMKAQLEADGHTVALTRISDEPQRVDAKHDVLLLASPIHGGAPAQPMQDLLVQMQALRGKKAALLMTGSMGPKLRGLGVRTMRTLCEDAGVEVIGTACVGWTGRRKRPQRIADAVKSLAGCFV